MTVISKGHNTVLASGDKAFANFSSRSEGLGGGLKKSTVFTNLPKHRDIQSTTTLNRAMTMKYDKHKTVEEKVYLGKPARDQVEKQIAYK